MRDAEKAIIPLRGCCDHKMRLLPYFPLASGLLSGKYRGGQHIPTETISLLDRMQFIEGLLTKKIWRLSTACRAIADGRGITLAQLGYRLAWRKSDCPVA